MDTETIIAELEAERDRLDQAIAALRSVGNGSTGNGSARNGRRGHLSAAARKRISQAMKKKWAARKKAGAA